MIGGNKNVMSPNGLDAKTFFEGQGGITYNDFILLPGHIDFALDAITLETNLTRNIKIKRPLVSSPMDTVTEARMAICMALLGGIGIIHYNNTIEEQVKEVRRVKRFENGFITDPVVLSPNHTIRDVDTLKETHGFSGIPITEDGTLNTKLAGISLAEGNKILKESKKGKLPLVDKQGRLVSLMSRTDLLKNEDFPFASKNKDKQLLVGAALSTREEDKERLAELVKAGVDVIVIDSSQGDSTFQINTIKYIKKTYPHLEVMGGNVVTAKQCKSLIDAGADALRIGMGSGSICITQDTLSVGRAQGSAIYHTGKFSKEYANIPVMADGGIAHIGHIVKALSLGASAVMMGGLLAGTSESPGEYFYEGGVRVKKYRGMASHEAMEKGGGKRYLSVEDRIKVAQGVTGTVVDKGSVIHLVQYLMQSLLHSLQELGCKSIQELHKGIYEGTLRFEMRSPSAQAEGTVHSLYSFKEPHLGLLRGR